MMGRDHAVLAGFLALAVGRVAGLPPAEQLVVAGVVAGASLIPDIDEPNSTVSHVLEPMSGWVSHQVARIADGHRQATHSLTAAVCVGLAAWAATLIRLGGEVTIATVILGLVLALAARALLPRFLVSHLVALGIGALVTYEIVAHMTIGLWLPLAVVGGWLAHLLGDWLTTGGVPLFWPVSDHHYALPILAHTGSWREHLMAWVLIAAGYLIAYPVVGSMIH